MKTVEIELMGPLKTEVTEMGSRFANHRAAILSWLVKRTSKASEFSSRQRFVFASSMLDAGLAFYFRHSIFDLEQNELCLMLMRLEPDYLSVFLIAKILGTVAAVGLIGLVYRRNKEVGNIVSCAIVLFMAGLITYQLAR